MLFGKKKKKEPFWKQGVRFECQGSGNCCTSRDDYGYVFLTLQDRRRLAAHLGIPTAVLTKQYCEKTPEEEYHLRHPELDCCFLEEKRCSVYEARPTQCRTWPFWPENMPPKVWKKEIVSSCPGIGKGRLYTAEEIERMLEGEELE